MAKLKFLSLYRDLVQVLKGALFHDFIKKIRCLFSPQALFDLDQIQSVFHLGIKPYKDYAQFKGCARKIPENVLQEDPKLLMWYDQALTRSGEE